MRLVAVTLLALAGSVAPALAAEPPVGDYYCHDAGTVPTGLFSITGAGTYDWKTVGTIDFKTFKDDPSNGPGTYVVDPDGTMRFEGPFADEWQVVATWESGWIWFANEYGGVMRCGTALAG